jgi:hypothetical protein
MKTSTIVLAIKLLEDAENLVGVPTNEGNAHVIGKARAELFICRLALQGELMEKLPATVEAE